MFLLEQYLNKLIWNSFSGEFFSKQLGDGYDLEDFRQYQIGDPIKRINWKLSAKYDQEYVWVYHMEKEAKVDVVIDNNLNAKFFSEILEKLFFLLNQYKTKFWLVVNFYIFDKNWNLVQIYNIDEIWFNKKNKIQLSKSKNYRVIVSDFLFWDNLEETDFRWDYLWVFPIKKVLKNSEIPTLNGYFSSFLNSDFLQEYDKLLDLLKTRTIVEELD